jgi:hypothetical protein
MKRENRVCLCGHGHEAHLVTEGVTVCPHCACDAFVGPWSARHNPEKLDD